MRNPCPGAEHFGAPDLERDVERGTRATQSGRWRRVRCRSVDGESPGNTFYALTTAVVRAEVAAGAAR